MKKILLLTTLFLASLVSYGQNFNLDVNYLDYGDNAPYEDGFITWTADWEIAGWSFMQGLDQTPTDLSSYTDVVIKFQAVPFAFQVKVRYGTAAAFTESEQIVNAGLNEITIPLIDAKKNQVLAIYLQDRDGYAGYPDPLAKGTVVLTEAYLVNSIKTTIPYYEFEVAETVGCKYPSAQVDISDSDDFEGVTDMLESAFIATVVNTGNPGNALKIFMSDYNQVIKLPIVLPSGATVADIERIKVDISIPDATADADIYKALLISINGVTFNGKEYVKRAEIGGAWFTNDIAMEGMAGLSEVSTLNAFDLYIGLDNYDTGLEYLMDNIALVIKGRSDFVRPEPEPNIAFCGTSVVYVNADSNIIIYTIEGGIAIDSEGAKTTVYGVDGSVVASTFANTISLQKGLYIVKVGDAPAAKVIVK